MPLPYINVTAQRCDGCSRMTYDVERLALFVAGVNRAERDLCAACRTNALDGFLVAKDGMKIAKVSV